MDPALDPSALDAALSVLMPKIGLSLLCFTATGLLEWVLEVLWSDGLPWRSLWKDNDHD